MNFDIENTPEWIIPFEAPESEPVRDPNTYPLAGTFEIVIRDFQTEPESTFQGLRYAVRENHRTMLRRVSGRYGHWRLSDIDTRDRRTSTDREEAPGGVSGRVRAYLQRIGRDRRAQAAAPDHS